MLFCFIFSVVMGLTGLPQRSVEQTVAEIAVRGNAQGGWIAADSAQASVVLAGNRTDFGAQIQVIELQNSTAGACHFGPFSQRFPRRSAPHHHTQYRQPL